ncbi:hypothetical protein LUZ62_027767 [Rhynchospora pubera]|uniref:Uncharacterized protein n=1 Tax=Rhynchospora pubera TaxID=906938 RepID=A0AAV8HJ31_9POAL|nr:hypothetical protein LUZ62_027767 [Rhynchospora pubera]
MEGTESVLNPHDKMRGRSVNRVATGEQAPRPAHEPGTITDAPPLSPELTDESGRVVELKTAPADRRFPFGNQTRHCYARYLEYYWCVKQQEESLQNARNLLATTVLFVPQIGSWSGIGKGSLGFFLVPFNGIKREEKAELKHTFL